MIVCFLGIVALVLDFIMPNHRVKALILQMRAAEERKSRLLKVSNIKLSNGNQEECDRVVIKNMDPFTDILQIKCELEELGYNVMSVRNAYNQSIGIALPVFFVKLRKDPKNSSIYNLRYVAHQVVVIEAYKQCPDPPRCTYCQELSHTKDTCRNLPICTWCSGRHYTSLCKKADNSRPTCVRCSGSHPSNYKGCIVYQRLVWEKENGKVLISGQEPKSGSTKTSSETSKGNSEWKKKISEGAKAGLQERKANVVESKAMDKRTNVWECRRSSRENKNISEEIKMNLQVSETSSKDNKTTSQEGEAGSQRKWEISKEREKTSWKIVKNSQERKIDSMKKKTSSQEREADSQASSEGFDSLNWDNSSSSSDSSKGKLSLLESLLRNPDIPVEEEANYPVQWTPPDEPLISIENLRNVLDDMMQHLLSMNEDLMTKMLVGRDCFSTSFVARTIEEAFSSNI